MKKLNELNNPSLIFDNGHPQKFYTELTLLDMGAIAAVQGMLASETEEEPWPLKELTERGYAISKALLEERERVLSGKADNALEKAERKRT